MNIFVGTAGFSYKDWEGVVYPADLKKRKIRLPDAVMRMLLESLGRPPS